MSPTLEYDIMDPGAKYCRLCVGTLDHNDFEKFSMLKAPVTFLDVIKRLCKVNIEKLDSYSKLVCTRCWNLLDQIVHFRQVIQNADLYLKAELRVNRPRKTYSKIKKPDIVVKSIELLKTVDRREPELFNDLEEGCIETEDTTETSIEQPNSDCAIKINNITVRNIESMKTAKRRGRPRLFRNPEDGRVKTRKATKTSVKQPNLDGAIKINNIMVRNIESMKTMERRDDCVETGETAEISVEQPNVDCAIRINEEVENNPQSDLHKNLKKGKCRRKPRVKKEIINSSNKPNSSKIILKNLQFLKSALNYVIKNNSANNNNDNDDDLNQTDDQDHLNVNRKSEEECESDHEKIDIDELDLLKIKEETEEVSTVTEEPEPAPEPIIKVKRVKRNTELKPVPTKLKMKSTDIAMVAHRRKVHKDVPTFQCEYCNQIFYIEQLYMEHLENHSTVENKESEAIEIPKIKCEQCHETFNNRSTLNVHVKKMHPHRHVNRVLQCNICGKKLASEKMLYYHKIERHSVKRRFQCGKCQKQFHFKQTLREHLRKELILKKAVDLKIYKN